MKKMTMVVVGLVLCLGAVQARAGWCQDFYGGVYNFGDDEYISDDGRTIGVYEDADGVAAVVNLYLQIYLVSPLAVLGPGTVNIYDGPTVNGINAYDNCTVNIYNAEASQGAFAWENSTINVYGGAGCDSFYARGMGTVNIYGSDFVILQIDGVPVEQPVPNNSLPFTIPVGHLYGVSGTLADGTAWMGLVTADGIIRLMPSQPIVLEATIDVDPDTLNLNSNGKWITCYIELPEGYNVDEIDVSSVKLNDTVPAEPKPTNIGDYDDDGIADLMVKFSRAAVQGILTPGEATVTVAGELADGTAFQGTDVIQVIDKGGKKK